MKIIIAVALCFCEGANKVNDFSKDVCISQPYVLVIDNSDSPSIVEQLSQGPSLSYNTFIDDRP